MNFDESTIKKERMHAGITHTLDGKPVLCVQWFDAASYEAYIEERNQKLKVLPDGLIMHLGHSTKEIKVLKKDQLDISNMSGDEVYNIYKKYTEGLPEGVYGKFDLFDTKLDSNGNSRYLMDLARNNTPVPIHDDCMNRALFAAGLTKTAILAGKIAAAKTTPK